MNSDTVEWITPAQALAYLQERFQKMRLPVGPSRSALYRWLEKGYIRTHRHRKGKLWFTTLDWCDEAIMWKRIPPRNGRPAIAKRIEFAIGDKEYVATQGCLL